MAGSLVFLVGVLVCLGWAFDSVAIKSVLLGWPKMAASTAVAFALSGMALWLIATTPTNLSAPLVREKFILARRWVTLGCAGSVALIGLLTLSEYLLRWNLGIDQLGFKEAPHGLESLSPSRMAPLTAFNFVLLGGALLLTHSSRFLGVFQTLALLGGLIGLLGFSRYLYGGEPLIPYAQMAIHTAVTFLLLSTGILCERTDGGLIALLLTDGAGGASARQLLPPALFIPFALGWLRLQGQYAGWYGTEAGLFLFALSNVVVFSALVWANAARLHRSDMERKQAEEALRESERRFRALIEHSSDGIAVIDADNNILYLSPAVATVEGYTAEELIGRNGIENTHSDDLPLLHKIVQQLLDHPGQPFPVLWRRRHKDGHWLWLEGVAINLLQDPAVQGIVTNYRDVTERKLAERKLETQLAHLELLNHITRAIGERQDLPSIFQVVVCSLEDNLPIDFGCFCLYNQPDDVLTVACVGVRSEGLALELAMSVQTRIPIDRNGLSQCVQGQLVYEPDLSKASFPFLKKLCSAGLCSLIVAPLQVESQVFGVLIAARRQPHSFSSGECEFLRQLSDHIALAAHQTQLYSALQQAYDDLRQTQQAVLQQERLRALGQMASGIAHDINNAISPMMLYIESLLEKEPNLSPGARERLETIQSAIDDVTATVARLREFYRQREPQLASASVHLNRLVQQVVDLTSARWSNIPQQRGLVIDLRTDLASDLPAILGVESELREALINLVFNAVDAMPDGGTLTLRTRLSDAAASAAGAPGLRYVYIEVTDTGVGMDEETQRRCLEPFFTTKGERGTGLGLAMVYGIVQRHGAELEIVSTVGQGTTMRLSFAVLATLVADSSPPPVTYAAPSQLRILVVDDDPLLIKSLRDTLEGDGHVITTADGGQAGIEAFSTAQQGEEPFAAVITDLGMPYVDGRKVAAAIKAASLATPVILLTGWGQRLEAEGDAPSNVDRVLSKPPKLRELRVALAELTASATPIRRS